MRAIHAGVVTAWALVCAAGAQAQWNPSAGQWGKTDPNDIRVMTWNVRDALTSNNLNKVENRNNWTALARAVAAIKPDVLMLQECGDRSSNGGSGVDSVAQLTTVMTLFLRGGTDPFNGNAQVTAFVQKYAPTYDLPHIFVSNSNDGFNRNVILSRFPFADLNGDGVATVSDFFTNSDLYAPGGGGGIRGFATAEIDLPANYAGNLVIGNSHLRSGGASSDLQERLVASQNIAYYIDYLFNGGGTGTPDPRGRIQDIPAVQTVLSAATPVIWGGDWNEDEDFNNRKGPAEWMTQASVAGGTDGTDRNRSDSTFDASLHLLGTLRTTFGTGSSARKLDYLAWQDSVATLRRSWVLNTGVLPTAAYAPEIVGFTGGANTLSTFASDHLPVIADFILPLGQQAPGAFTLVAPADGSAGLPLRPTFSWTASAGVSTYTLRITPASATPIEYTGLTATSFVVPTDLAPCTSFTWGVTAINGSGSTASSPASRGFTTLRPSDLNNDDVVDVNDFFVYLALFSSNDLRADTDGSGTVDVNDFFAFLDSFSRGC